MDFINADLSNSTRAVICVINEHLLISLKLLNQLRDRLRFHVLIGATMKNTIFRQVTSCSPADMTENEEELAAYISQTEDGDKSFIRTDGKFIQHGRRQNTVDTSSPFHYKIQNKIRKICSSVCNKEYWKYYTRLCVHKLTTWRKILLENLVLCVLCVLSQVVIKSSLLWIPSVINYICLSVHKHWRNKQYLSNSRKIDLSLGLKKWSFLTQMLYSVKATERIWFQCCPLFFVFF
jgi:hypothetical protein